MSASSSDPASRKPERAARSRTPDAPGPPAAARAINTTALAGIAVALGLVAAAAAPSILVAAGIRPADEGSFVAPVPMVRNQEPHIVVVPPHSAIDDDDDDPRTELEKLYPNAPWPGRPAPAAAAEEASPGAVEPGGQIRYGRALRGFQLLEKPGDLTHATGEVKAQELVMIVKEQDGWVLVLRSGAFTEALGGSGQPAKIDMGWAKKSEIAIR